jgi:osmoprotectant transport system permease protein
MVAMTFIIAHLGELMERSGELLALCLVALSSALLLGVPLGVLCAYRNRLAERVLAASAATMAIPGLALIGLMMAVTGGPGLRPTLAVMILYALIPIIRSTRGALGALTVPGYPIAGLREWFRFQDPAAIDLQTAIPALIGGLRSAAIGTIGSATLCSMIGGGGLGVFIVRGAQTRESALVLMGAVPITLLVVMVDQLFVRWLGRISVQPPAG